MSEDNVDFSKDVFKLNEVIITNIIKKTLLLHSLIFSQFQDNV